MNRRNMLKGSLLVGAAGAGAAVAQTGPVTVRSAGPGAARYAEALRRIAAQVERHRRDNALPALTLTATDVDGWTLAIDSGISDPAQRTPLRPDQLFQIGSISKSITALAIWRASEAGRLSLDQDARELLPGAAWPDARITVAQLLNHSSGLPDDAPRFPRGGDGRLWVGFEPGSRWSYSNTGYDLLGLILERIHHRRLGEILETEVLRPMGLPTAAGAILSEDRDRYPVGHAPYHMDRPYPSRGELAPAAWVDVTFGAGCVAAPSREMATYLRWLIGAAGGRGAGLLSDTGAAAFCRPTIDAPAWNGGGRYGNGLAILQRGGRTLIHHTGGMVSFNSAFHVDAAAGVGAFASTPVGMIDYRPRDLTLYATAVLRAAREGRPLPDSPRATTPKVAAHLAGAYRTADGRGFELIAVSGGLRMRAEGSEAELERMDEDAWLSRHPRFQRYALTTEHAGGRLRGFWSGPDFYAAPGSPHPPAAPPTLQALAGRYENDDPWTGGPKRVVARHDGLWLDGTQKLTSLPDGAWRVGDESWSPERIRFDAVMDGRPQRLTLSGHDLLRVEEPQTDVAGTWVKVVQRP